MNFIQNPINIAMKEMTGLAPLMLQLDVVLSLSANYINT